jgi:SAM-dependent methyltransferase
MNAGTPMSITIAIPVYSPPRAFLEACLRSVAGARAVDDEVFVVVDGPQSPEIEEALLAVEGLGFTLCRQPQRIGLVANWNACLEVGSRALVHVMHADDAVAADFYAEARGQMRSDDVVAVAAGAVRSGRRATVPLVLRTEAAARYLLSHEKPPAGSFVLRRSSLGMPPRGFDPRFAYCPDEELFLWVLQSGGLALIDRGLYRESRHDRQARFATWHQVDFADTYFDARTEGARAIGTHLVPIARRETSRRLLSVGRALCSAGDTRASRRVIRSIVAHDSGSVANWKLWALAVLTASRRPTGHARPSTPNEVPAETNLAEWDERAHIGPGTEWFWDPLGAQHMARYLWADATAGAGLIVDIACGTGYGSALLAGPGRRVLGFDVSAEAVAYAQHHHGSAGVSFTVGDATRFPLAAASADVVVSFETIEHLNDPAAFLAEVERVLRPGGMLLLSTPDQSVYSRGQPPGSSKNPFHPSEMTRAELLALLAPRFRLREVLGQSRPRMAGSRPGAGIGSIVDGVRAVMKHAIRRVTAPIVRVPALAHRLFPILRRAYLPTRSTAGGHTYVIVLAEKP